MTNNLPLSVDASDVKAPSQEEIANFASEIGSFLPTDELNYHCPLPDIVPPFHHEENGLQVDVSNSVSAIFSSQVNTNRGLISPSSDSQLSSFSDNDVLFGRGGGTNKHPGNIKFRQVAKSLQEKYRSSLSKARKTEISTSVLDLIKSNGGRFLEINKETGLWEEVPMKRARTKVAQILR